MKNSYVIEQYDKLEIENVELKEQINKLKDQLKVDLEYHKSVFIKNMKDLKEMSEAELETLRQKYENSKIESQNRGKVQEICININ